jgi:hypothetical protein
MYRVFTDDEIALWEDYTNGLERGQPAAPMPEPSAARQMADLVDALRVNQHGSLGHQEAMMLDLNGVAHSMAWWFQQPTASFLSALGRPQNGYVTPGQPEESRLFTEFAAPTGPMGPVFDQAAPGQTGVILRDVLFHWIKQGCPAPSAAAMVLRMSTPPEKRNRHPTGRRRGMGVIH